MEISCFCQDSIHEHLTTEQPSSLILAAPLAVFESALESKKHKAKLPIVLRCQAEGRQRMECRFKVTDSCGQLNSLPPHPSCQHATQHLLSISQTKPIKPVNLQLLLFLTHHSYGNYSIVLSKSLGISFLGSVWLAALSWSACDKTHHHVGHAMSPYCVKSAHQTHSIIPPGQLSVILYTQHHNKPTNQQTNRNKILQTENFGSPGKFRVQAQDAVA